MSIINDKMGKSPLLVTGWWVVDTFPSSREKRRNNNLILSDTNKNINIENTDVTYRNSYGETRLCPYEIVVHLRFIDSCPHGTIMAVTGILFRTIADFINVLPLSATKEETR